MPSKSTSNKKSNKKEKKSKLVSKDDDMELYEEPVDDIDFDVEEDEFFDEKNFKEFNTKIKFHVFCVLIYCYLNYAKSTD